MVVNLINDAGVMRKTPVGFSWTMLLHSVKKFVYSSPCTALENRSRLARIFPSCRSSLSPLLQPLDASPSPSSGCF